MPSMFPRIGDGAWADAKIGDYFHLRLFCTETGLGPGAAVFDVAAQRWLPDREWADSIEDGQKRAERIARDYHKRLSLRQPFPALVWKRTDEK